MLKHSPKFFCRVFCRLPLLGLLGAGVFVGVLWGCGSGGQASGGGESRRDPHEILSKTRKTTFNLLGTPDLNRREGRTMQWQYRGDSCTLDVFFVGRGFEAIRKNAAVEHFELRPSSSEARMNRGELERCYARLVKTRRKSARARDRG